MSLRLVRWITIAGPLAFLALLALLREALDAALFAGPGGYLLLGAVAILGIVSFAQVVFRTLARAHDRLAQRNRELESLHRAGLAIAGQLHLETVLQEVVDQARELVEARYGALSFLREGGGIEAFLTSGISAEERARIGALPVGRGLTSTFTPYRGSMPRRVSARSELCDELASRNSSSCSTTSSLTASRYSATPLCCWYLPQHASKRWPTGKRANSRSRARSSSWASRSRRRRTASAFSTS